MTAEQTVYHERVRIVADAVETGNVAEIGRVFGVSTSRCHQWRTSPRSKRIGGVVAEGEADTDDAGLDTDPCLEVSLTLVVMLTVLGCCHHSDRLANQGFTPRRNRQG